MEENNKKIFELQAEVCKILTNPKRLEIIHALKEGEKTVTELVNILGISKANVSQHLSILKQRGIVNARREGVNIFYSITNPKVIQACTLMREVLIEQLKKQKLLLSNL